MPALALILALLAAQADPAAPDLSEIGRALQGRQVTALEDVSNAPRGFHRVESVRSGAGCSLSLVTQFTPTDQLGVPVAAARPDRLELRLDRLTFIYGDETSGLIDLMFGEGEDELLLDFSGLPAEHARTLG